ncbi:hypothetical protein [Pedobacter aquatilis]|uniref:hypothetical protein n=1 Tax=Pedobacter aquatilis TaxID=351343 RepID=UPI00293031AC|nr:hypothetical protein [Pedobacter aquatilis]
MNNSQIYDYLEKTFPVSSGLAAYLDVALKEFRFEKNQIIPDDFFVDNPLCFLSQGTIKTQVNGLKEPGQHLVRFTFSNSVIPDFGKMDSEDYSKTTTSIEASLIKALPLKHEYNLFKLFPEYHQLITGLHRNQLTDLMSFIFELRFEEGNERLANLLKIQPRLFQIASVSDISAAIGVHPHTLSTYRR